MHPLITYVAIFVIVDYTRSLVNIVNRAQNYDRIAIFVIVVFTDPAIVKIVNRAHTMIYSY